LVNSPLKDKHMKPVDQVGITFANLVLGNGINNNVVNISFGAFEFNASEDGKTVDPAPVITCRLRTDVPCARALYKVLGDLLESIDRPSNGKTLKHDPSEPVGKAN
jgi:hypothetical protein